MKGKTLRLFGAVMVTTLLSVALPAQSESAGKQQKKVQKEESEDYYSKWLDQDVLYIISDQERSVFSKLSTDEERENFIEQFWQRRDPDIRTAVNEFKEEHYRRLAYVEEHFSSGVPGWKTDRGRVYIIHGDPVQIEKHTYGQSYERPMHEGGGRTATLPFEIWRYHHIEGIGTDVEIEFVDPTGSGEFRLALTPWEKDALLLTPTGGPTLAESSGLARREDHPFFNGVRDDYAFMHNRMLDNPFIRYERIAKIRANPIVKYTDLKELVEVNVSFATLPIDLHQAFFQLNEERVLVPLTVSIENKDLTFKLENGVQVAQVGIYGVITDMSNRLVTEFEDDLTLSFKPEIFKEALLNRAVYQKTIPLESKMRYKLDLVMKDLTSEKTGVVQKGIIPPRYEATKLSSSSIILSRHVQQLEELPEEDEMFVIGDVKVRPNVTDTFRPDEPFWIYFHVYNLEVDQTALRPAVSVSYRLLRDGEDVFSVTDEIGESIRFFSDGRGVLTKQLSVNELSPGRYTLAIEINDRISTETLKLQKRFQIADTAP